MFLKKKSQTYSKIYTGHSVENNKDISVGQIAEAVVDTNFKKKRFKIFKLKTIY